MSNTARIWLTYLSILVGAAAFLGAPLLAMVLDVSEFAFGCFVLAGVAAAIAIMVFVMKFAVCWRCEAPLFRTPLGAYSSFVLWRRCPTCGVKHASHPDDVRRDPIAHLRQP